MDLSVPYQLVTLFFSSFVVVLCTLRFWCLILFFLLTSVYPFFQFQIYLPLQHKKRSIECRLWMVFIHMFAWFFFLQLFPLSLCCLLKLNAKPDWHNQKQIFLSVKESRERERETERNWESIGFELNVTNCTEYRLKTGTNVEVITSDEKKRVSQLDILKSNEVISLSTSIVQKKNNTGSTTVRAVP